MEERFGQSDGVNGELTSATARGLLLLLSLPAPPPLMVQGKRNCLEMEV